MYANTILKEKIIEIIAIIVINKKNKCWNFNRFRWISTLRKNKYRKIHYSKTNIRVCIFRDVFFQTATEWSIFSVMAKPSENLSGIFRRNIRSHYEKQYDKCHSRERWGIRRKINSKPILSFVSDVQVYLVKAPVLRTGTKTGRNYLKMANRHVCTFGIIAYILCGIRKCPVFF